MKPQVYMKVTSNYLDLTMRYVVDPKQRRKASSFIYWRVFERLQQQGDIQIGSSTMSVTVDAAKDLQSLLKRTGTPPRERRHKLPSACYVTKTPAMCSFNLRPNWSFSAADPWAQQECICPAALLCCINTCKLET